MADGWCTLEDVRRVIRNANLPGDIDQDNRIATDAIVAQTEPLEKDLDRYWYEPDSNADIVTEASSVDIPQSAATRNDEHDIPRHGGLVHGADEWPDHRRRQNSDALLESGPRHERRRTDFREPKQQIRVARGDADALERPIDTDVPVYTRIRMVRRDVQTLNELLVLNADGGYDDWVASNDYSGGVGLANRGEDYWVRINNGGVSELYLNIHALDDDIASLANAVYVDYDYGHEGIPRSIRRAVAFRATAELADDAVLQVPTDSDTFGAESLAEFYDRKAAALLDEYR